MGIKGKNAHAYTHIHTHDIVTEKNIQKNLIKNSVRYCKLKKFVYRYNII